ncbi:unnamed protein product [Caenorhabditis nigoni]
MEIRRHQMSGEGHLLSGDGHAMCSNPETTIHKPKMLYTIAAVGACAYFAVTDSIVKKAVVETVKAVVWPTSDEQVAAQMKEKKTDKEDEDWALY